jgi:glycosyltransferase involved in cell wall biosynthesis
VISYVIPTLNEEGSIGKVIDRIRKIDMEGEIIVVDSDSTDRTAEIAKSKGANVVNEPRRGYGYAYRKGFSVVKGDIICTLDGDGTYPPEEIPSLLREIERGYDFVCGERLTLSSDEAMIPMHRAGNFILNVLTRVMFFVDIRDSQSGMWLFRREIMQNIMPIGTGMEFSEEIKIRSAAEYCYKEISIHYSRRMGEKKLKPWKDGIRNLLFLVKLRFTGGIRTRHFRCSQSWVL